MNILCKRTDDEQQKIMNNQIKELGNKINWLSQKIDYDIDLVVDSKKIIEELEKPNVPLTAANSLESTNSGRVL